jgi:hypothetical protein
MLGCLLLFPLTQEWRSFLSCQIFRETGNVERVKVDGHQKRFQIIIQVMHLNDLSTQENNLGTFG